MNKENLAMHDVHQVEDTATMAMSAHDQLVHEGEEIESLDKTLTLGQSLKAHRMVVLYVMAAYSCAATYGYDTIANGASLSMPAFLLYFGHYDPVTDGLYLDSIWVSLWSSMTGVGQVIGALAAGYVAQKFGRRWCSIGFAAWTVVGVALQYVATSGGLLLAGKIINGVAVGALLAVGTTYASEITPLSLRGPILGFLAFFAVMMQMVGLGIVRAFVPDVAERAFRTVFALQWAVGGLPILLFFLVPESPSWLLLRGNHEAAKKSLERLYGKDNHIDARIAHMNNILRHEKSQEGGVTYIDCFRGTNLKRTLTVCLLFWGNGMIGSSFLSQNIYFLIIAGLSPIHCFDIGVGGFALGLLVIPASSIFSERVGRRPLYLIGILGNAIGMAIVGSLGYTNSIASTWAVAVLLNLLISWQLFTCFMTSWSMAPEISSYKLRQPTQGIGYVVQAVTTLLFLFITPYMYNVDSGNLGAKTGFIFMGTTIIQGLMSWLWVPETKGLSTEDIDWLYEEKVSPRNFAKRENVMVTSKADM